MNKFTVMLMVNAGLGLVVLAACTLARRALFGNTSLLYLNDVKYIVSEVTSVKCDPAFLREWNNYCYDYVAMVLSLLSQSQTPC